MYVFFFVFGVKTPNKAALCCPLTTFQHTENLEELHDQIIDSNLDDESATLTVTKNSEDTVVDGVFRAEKKININNDRVKVDNLKARGPVPFSTFISKVSFVEFSQNSLCCNVFLEILDFAFANYKSVNKAYNERRVKFTK